MTTHKTRTAEHPEVRSRGGRTARERFWSKVNKDGPTMPHMDSPCWVWTASTAYYGYGQFDGDRTHRISWELVNGPIPSRLNVCHRCDNPPCVNPAHLFLGNHRDNARDMVAKGRWRGPQEEHVAERFRNGPWGTKLTHEMADAIRREPGPQWAIAAKYGVTQPVVSRIKNGRRWGRQKTEGWTPPAAPSSSRPGEANARAIITTDTVIAVRQMAKTGASIKEVSVRFGISYLHAYDIVKRRSWKHIQETP